MIIEEEQGGEERAKYGRKLLGELSAYLSKRVGKGFSETNLRNARKFYQVYAPSIQQTMSAELGDEQQNKIQQTMSAKSDGATNNQIQQSLVAESEKRQTLFSVMTGTAVSQKGQAALFESYPFTLSWSHYLILMRIKDEQERRFYEIEATKHQWDVRYLQSQYGSSLYERLALSRDKIVVVPSIAIREGVKKTFEITGEHFQHAYKRKARFFVYSSSNLHLLDEFS